MSISRRPYPTYRDSDVPWLGEIPTHWEVRRIRQIGRLGAGAGFPHRKQGVQDAELPFYKVSDMNLHGNDVFMSLSQHSVSRETARELGAEAFSAGSIIFPKVGAALLTNKRRILTMQSCVDNNIMVLTPEAGNNKYVYYQLLGLDLGRLANPGAVPSINETQAKEIDLIFPPVHEQRVIATFLDRETAKIDTLIRKQERLIELLEEKRAALISQAVTKGLDPDVPLKDSDVRWLGKIPEQWDFAPLKYFVAQTPDAVKTGPFGSQLLSSEMTDGEIKVYNQRNVIDRDLTEGDNYISQDKFEELEAFRVCPGDILVTTRGTIGRCVTVPEDAELGILHPCLMRIDADPRRLLRGYLIYLIQDSFLVQTQLFLMSNATTIEVIYSSSLRQVLVPRPPVGQQVAIIDYLDRETARIDALIDRVRGVIDRLYEYRTALISAAVTGKIDVRGEVPSA